MKKTSTLILVLIIILCSGCGNKKDSYNNDNKPQFNLDEQNQHFFNQDSIEIGNTSENKYNEAKDYCDQLVAYGEVLSAYIYISELAETDPMYNNLVSTYGKLYMEDVLHTANSYASQGDYKQAISILRDANGIYNCSEFTTKIAEYESYMPRNLANIKVIDDDDYKYLKEAEDCFGNVYQGVFGFDESYGGPEGGYAIFYLNGKYNNLSGVFVGSDELYEDMEVECKIYADGKLIYESSKLGRTSPPVNINLDVSGVEQLKVEYMWYSWWTMEPCCIFDLTAS